MTPVVLLHGSATGAYGWRGVMRGLRDAVPPLRVFAPDMLGYGAAPPPSDRYTLAEEVAHLTRAVDAQGIDTFHLVTHSLGTMYGLHWRLSLRHRVRRMTLVDPLVRSILRNANDVPSYEEMDGPYRAFQAAWPDAHLAVRGFVDLWNGEGTWDTMAPSTRDVLADMARKVRLELREAWADLTTLETLTAQPPPTQILVGENTRIAPRSTARLLASALRAKVIPVSKAGHMVPITHPDDVARAIVAFTE